MFTKIARYYLYYAKNEMSYVDLCKLLHDIQYEVRAIKKLNHPAMCSECEP